MTDALANALRVAASQTERNPTDAQKEAGNYPKGKVRFAGLEIAIENPKGGTRSGVDKGGKRWRVTMPAHYGYVKGTEGHDGDHVDVYLGPDTGAQKVYVVDQIDAETGEYDEHKCLLCYGSKSAALADYEKAFSDGKAKDRIGAVTEMSVDAFKDWLRSGNTKKPLGDLRKGYAAGGAVAMPSKHNGQSPADRALGRYADGGAPDWRSDMDKSGPGYDPRRGEVRGERKPDILREVRPAAERALDAVLDYGSVPARTAVGMAMEPMTAISEAYDDPSLANVTNAGVQSALLAGPFAPVRAGKAALGAAGLGFGLAGARDAGLSPLGGAEAADGLNADQAKRLQTLQRKRSLSRAEREEQNTLMAIQGRFQELQARQVFEAQARRDAALIENEKAQKAGERAEFDRAVATADKAKADELGKYTPFKDTEVGKVYDKLGIAAPLLGAMGAGALSRTAGRLGGKSGLMTESVAPALVGGGTAGVMANWPLGHEIVFAPAENPERRAYEAYSRELPPTHPRKQEWQDYARGLPVENPTRKAATDEFYDPVKFAERTGLGIAEGLISGPAGAHLSKVLESAPKAALKSVARAPGELAESYYEGMGQAAKARGKALKAGQSGDRLLGSDAELRRIEPEFRRAESSLDEGIAEAQRRTSAPGASSGLSEAAPPARPSLSLEASPSPTSSPPAISSPNDIPLPPGLARNSRGVVYDTHTGQVVKKRFLTERAPKKGSKPKPSPMSEGEGFATGGGVMRRALDVARRFATGGAVIAGPVVGETGGREDAKPVDVAAGSYVIPADCVSALGEGNSMAGHQHLNKVFGEAATRAAGGAIPILISDGEHVLTPEQVEKIGGGDMKRGHQVLDALVKKVRAAHIETLKSLPGPAKGNE